MFLGLAGVAAQRLWFGMDHDARQFIGLAHHPWLDSSMQTLSLLGEGSGLIPLIALASLLLWRYRGPRALLLPVIMAGTGWLQLVAKWAVDRPRPNLAAWGFPSGHVLSLVVFFGLVAYLLWGSRIGRNWRCVAGGVGAGTVLAVAFSRLYLDAHWLSDVAAGFMLGLTYLLLTIWLVESLGHRRLRRAVVPLIASDPAPAAASSLTAGTATTPA